MLKVLKEKDKATDHALDIAEDGQLIDELEWTFSNIEALETQLKYQMGIAIYLKKRVDEGEGCKEDENEVGYKEKDWCAFQCFKEFKHFEDVNKAIEGKLNNPKIGKESYDYGGIDEYIEKYNGDYYKGRVELAENYCLDDGYDPDADSSDDSEDDDDSDDE